MPKLKFLRIFSWNEQFPYEVVKVKLRIRGQKDDVKMEYVFEEFFLQVSKYVQS